MSSSPTEEGQGPRSGHLDATWEVAVVSTFAVVFIALVTVIILQVRRRRRERRGLEESDNARPRRRKASPPSSTTQERDLEKGVQEMGAAEAGSDIETESEDGDTPEPKPKQKTRAKSSRSKTKTKRSSRSSRKSHPPTSPASSIKGAAQPSSSDYYFEHPSQKPPKYYWDPQ